VKNLRFTQRFRLLHSSQFEFVFSNASIKAGNDYILLLARPNTLTYSRLGLITPKKKIKKAVNRNRFKRLAREHFRKRREEINSLDIIALAKNNITVLTEKEQNEVINTIFNLLIKKQSNARKEKNCE
jgi:ribonuclease P protein component